jgi:adenine-specific DNA-methyltransferase
MPLQLTWTDYPEAADSPDYTAATKFEPRLSADFRHLLSKGDNYPVLKKFAAGSADCPDFTSSVDIIYIDPPYNTGNDFTYNDKFQIRDGSGLSDRHSQWLSFMQRRLIAAKPLLKPTGCIFIAIDQSELYTLKLLCDQIFGEENFVNDFMWLHGKGKKDKWSRTLQQHTLCYAKNKSCLKEFSEIEYSSWATKNPDNDPRGNWFSGSISFSESRSNPNHHNYYSITSPSGKVWTRQWQVSQEEMEKLISENKIYWGQAPAYDGVPREKIFNDTETEVIPKNIIENVESTRSAQNYLDKLLGEKGLFDNPKPVDLIAHLIKICQLPSYALVMDFFAGSGTTFESVCRLNQEDGGKRRCLLVQKDESGIAEITRKRCEMVSAIYKSEITFVSAG